MLARSSRKPSLAAERYGDSWPLCCLPTCGVCLGGGVMPEWEEQRRGSVCVCPPAQLCWKAASVWSSQLGPFYLVCWSDVNSLRRYGLAWQTLLWSPASWMREQQQVNQCVKQGDIENNPSPGLLEPYIWLYVFLSVFSRNPPIEISIQNVFINLLALLDFFFFKQNFLFNQIPRCWVFNIRDVFLFQFANKNYF